MDSILNQIKDILPAAGIILGLGIVALGVGYFLMNTRTAVVKMGNSYEARGLRTLEELSSGKKDENLVMVTGTIDVAVETLVDPIDSAQTAVFCRHTVMRRNRKDREKRQIGMPEYTIDKEMEDQEAVPFNLKSGNEVFRVSSADLVSALLSSQSSASGKSEFGRELPEHYKRIAAKKGLSLKEFGMKKNLSFKSWVLHPGDTITVAGYLSTINGKPTVFPKGDRPVVLMNGDLNQSKAELEGLLD